MRHRCDNEVGDRRQRQVTVGDAVIALSLRAQNEGRLRRSLGAMSSARRPIQDKIKGIYPR